jgi:hypothetical protein
MFGKPAFNSTVKRGRHVVVVPLGPNRVAVESRADE